MDKQICIILNELFPKDIINVILLHSENWLIIQLQNYVPYMLKYIELTVKDIFDINENNYQFVTNLDCFCSHRMTDELISQFVNLKKLKCIYCRNITDTSICKLVNLTELFCSHNKITDASICNLVNLKKLQCMNCLKITDASVGGLVNLTALYCLHCPHITDASVSKLVNLTKLYAMGCIEDIPS